jgi:pentose-5-phosphate-3-epimerase
VRTISDQLEPDQRLQMDGGLSEANSYTVREAGCDVLVAATAIFGLAASKRAAAILNIRTAPAPASNV